jgi:hypothetical protein
MYALNHEHAINNPEQLLMTVRARASKKGMYPVLVRREPGLLGFHPYRFTVLA